MTTLLEAARIALGTLEAQRDKSSPSFETGANTLEAIDILGTAIAADEKAEPIGHLDGTDKLADYMSVELRKDHEARGSSTPKAFTVPVYAHPVQAEWKEAVLNQLAIHAMDAPVTDSPAVVIQKIIDMAVVMATDPAIGGVKPVQAEPLTYEAVERIWVNAPTGKTVAETRMDFARAIEAAHGIATTPEVRNAM